MSADAKIQAGRQAHAHTHAHAHAHAHAHLTSNFTTMFRSACVRYSASRSAWKSLSIKPQPQLAVHALKLFFLSTMVTCPHSGPLSLTIIYVVCTNGVTGGCQGMLVEVVGGGSDPFSHFTPLVRANSSNNSNFIEQFANFIRQTVERPNPDN